MTKEEIEKQMTEMEEKYKKLHKIAIKLAKEMDETVEKFHNLENMLKQTNE
jgi:hypothetical protein